MDILDSEASVEEGYEERLAKVALTMVGTLFLIVMALIFLLIIEFIFGLAILLQAPLVFGAGGAIILFLLWLKLIYSISREKLAECWQKSDPKRKITTGNWLDL